MDMQKNALFESFRDGKLTSEEYFQMTAEVDAYRLEQSKLEDQEIIAKDVERQILKAGGVAQKRDYGEIPNPFKHRFKNLTNQMAVRKNAPNLVDFLMADAGLIAPDRRLQDEQEMALRLERETAMRQQTDRLRRENDRMLGRQSAHPDFAGKIEASRLANRNVIPYFGGR